MKAKKAKSGKVNKTWLHEHINDPFVRLAQKENYRSRAVYKLQEIDQSMRILRAANVIVDLGCAPGAWCQYLSRNLHLHKEVANKKVIGVDLLPMEPVAGVEFIQGDFQSNQVLVEIQKALHNQRVDVVLSDMAPNLTGHTSTDSARVMNLIELAVDFAQNQLNPKGAMVAKVFHGAGYAPLLQLFKNTFEQCKSFKPKASRSHSAEVFLIGLGLK